MALKNEALLLSALHLNERKPFCSGDSKLRLNEAAGVVLALVVHHLRRRHHQQRVYRPVVDVLDLERNRSF